MTRQEHYQRAETILAPVDQRVYEGRGPGPDADWRTMLAQVHATLAAAPADVAGETQELVMELGSGQVIPVDVVDRAHLEAALEELERDTSSESGETAQAAARFIRERVLGPEEGR